MYNKKSKDNLNSVHSFTSNSISFLNSVHTNRYNKNTKKERQTMSEVLLMKRAVLANQPPPLQLRRFLQFQDITFC